MGTWTLTWSGLRTVMSLELRQRVRSSRWPVVLLLWMAALGGITALIRYATHTLYRPYPATDGQQLSSAELARAQGELSGRLMFGLVVFLVLSLGALVAPALSATSVNGDRRAGVLASLQVSLLSPAEIVVGRLLAAWLTALALLVAAAPFVAWAFVEGGTAFSRLLVTVLLTAVTLLVVCAIGLGWSAVTARTSSSVVLTYLTVTGLGLGLPLLFLLALPLTQQDDRVTYSSTMYVDPTSPNPEEPVDPAAVPNARLRCSSETQTVRRVHTERVWWLLAPSPYVVVADASPRPADRTVVAEDDLLSGIRSGVREARLGPRTVEGSCDLDPAQAQQRERERVAARERAGLTWPFGLTVDLLLATGATVVAIRRLRAPAAVLPRGVRVG
jgi:ABC-type transport system involved in multi-copper enzyme maturation permease subunit